jgi:hypothetical protein
VHKKPPRGTACRKKHALDWSTCIDGLNVDPIASATKNHSKRKTTLSAITLRKRQAAELPQRTLMFNVNRRDVICMHTWPLLYIRADGKAAAGEQVLGRELHLDDIGTADADEEGEQFEGDCGGGVWDDARDAGDANTRHDCPLVPVPLGLDMVSMPAKVTVEQVWLRQHTCGSCPGQLLCGCGGPRVLCTCSTHHLLAACQQHEFVVAHAVQHSHVPTWLLMHSNDAFCVQGYRILPSIHSAVCALLSLPCLQCYTPMLHFVYKATGSCHQC